MTPAFRYIASLYEHCVDAGLDLAQIRDALSARGIRRSLFQVADDLTRVYEFGDYAARHPAPVAQSLAQIDAAME